MTIDVTNTLFSSNFSGLHNYSSKDFSVTIPAQNIGVSSYVYYSASVDADNTNAVSQVSVNYGGLESQYRLVDGVVIVNKPVYNAPNYQIQTWNYFRNGRLYVDTIVVNQTGGVIGIPTITVNIRANFYLAPF